MLDHIRCMRPGHWIKNLFVAAPLVFAQKLLDPAARLDMFFAVLGFCLMSSAVYLINDCIDIDRDRKHPIKRKRPLPSGRVSVRSAAALAAVLIISAALVGFNLCTFYRILLAIYLFSNLAYSFWLKRAVILDVMIIAMGFVLRVGAGSVAVGVEASNWLLMCTFLLALFLGFGKRRHELVVLETEANHHREVLTHYSPYFLDQMISVVTASTVMSYALYTISPETIEKFGSNRLLFTTPFVLYGIFRYLFLVHERAMGGDPASLLFADKPFLLNLVSWVMIVMALIYL